MSLRFAQMLNKHIGWSDSVMMIGVDHEGYGRTCPPEFGVGDANANFLLRFCHIGTKRSILWPSKYTKTVFFGQGSVPDPAGGLCPWTPLGELTTLPHTPMALKGTPLPIYQIECS